MIKQNKSKLINTQTREHSLCYAKIWDDANRFDFGKYIVGSGVKNLLFIKKKNSSMLRIYYSENELDKIYKKIAKEINKNQKIFQNIIKTVNRETKILERYSNGKTKIKNFYDLEVFIKHWRNWWSAMAFIFAIPNIDLVEESIRKISLEKRKDIEKYSGAFDVVFINFFQQKYPQYKSFSNILLPKEIFSFSWDDSAKIKPKLKKVKERFGGYALLNGKIITLKNLNKELKNRSLFLEKIKNKKEEKFSGAIAFSGKTIGQIRVISSRDDLKSFVKGEILVTHMTSPEYLPQMKIAKAFITDEGGITCHAAIVAREIKKPCIIGTKIATQVLKDGDLVEVDADNGVVRILKKARSNKKI